MLPSTGLILGKFFPFHLGHINMILEASYRVDSLHLIICSESKRDTKLFNESLFNAMPMPEDRISWAETIFAERPNIHVHHLNEDGIPTYPNGWDEWTNRVFDLINHLGITPTHIFSSEPQDKTFYEDLFKLPVTLMDPKRYEFDISATRSRTTPFRYWSFIPNLIRPWFHKKIALYGETAESIAPLLALIYNSKFYKVCPSTIPDSITMFSFVIIQSEETLSSVPFHAVISDQKVRTEQPLLDLSAPLENATDQNSPTTAEINGNTEAPFNRAKHFIETTFRLIPPK